MSLTKRTIAFILSLVVFISSGGVVLAVHCCSKNPDKQVSFFKNNSCCNKKSSVCNSKNIKDGLKSKCCDSKISYHKVDIASISSEIHNIDFQNSIIQVLELREDFVPVAQFNFNFSNKAPPFYRGGKTFLSISQLFLI